ncbi:MULTISPECIES: hypothetical protein [Sorangium]|uniref:Uncharacterized protein n=1 Tax=Sorangium cellulosum TaxID=56 RepID=A0A4P2QV95_SORCE|nr:MULTISPECIES: hypothetical protein [Sorangium]AUX34340.1 uncharacterized protein SOCE836_065120 [Sorangium cellulosum]WCQ93658.1 hypothetical protein NQZ70_06410 [Sorangium sp. Soce836]
MNDLHHIGDTSFLENNEGEHAVRSYIRSFAHGREYVANRFIFHWHVYETQQCVPTRQLLAEYLTHVGYQPRSAEGLGEVTVARAYDIVEDMLRYDLARHEELVTEADARLSAARLRDETTWAVLAFTNLKRSMPSMNFPLAYHGFVRVVACENAEGGVLLVGEQDIAMIWFLDDDGPSRGMMDLKYSAS